MFTLHNDGLTTMERNIKALKVQDIPFHLRIAKNKGCMLSLAQLMIRLRPNDANIIGNEVARLLPLEADPPIVE